MFSAVLQEDRWPPGPAWLVPPVDRMTWGVVPPGPRGAVRDADECLCVSSGRRVSPVVVVFEGAVDDVRQASFEGPAGLRRRLAFGDFPQVVVLTSAAVAYLADRDDVQHAVQRAVASGVEAVAGVLAAGCVQGAVPV